MNALKRALQDIRSHRFLNVVTVATIALSVLIVSAFALFFVNASDVMGAWKKGVRIMAYLDIDRSGDTTEALKGEISRMPQVGKVRFISREEALLLLRNQMKGQASLFDTLGENPLPDALEIEVTGDFKEVAAVEALAARIEALPAVEDVEYGRQWVERFINIFNLFRLAAYGMGALFFMAAVFIMANTIRLVLYSRAEEVAIMRLVGATDSWIKAPFYIEGLILGAVGAAIGLLGLFLLFSVAAPNAADNAALGLLRVRFLPSPVLGAVFAGSMFVGWLGCFLSLNQSFKAEAQDGSR